MRAPDRERPSHGAIESALPRDALKDEGRDRDASSPLARNDEERGGRSADRRQGRREVIDTSPTERGIADVDDDQAEPLAAERRGGRERDTRATRAHDDEPLEIDVRTLAGNRVERRRRIDPCGHPTLPLRGR